MLTRHKKQIASELAESLIEDGMLFGEELEWYLKLGAKGQIEFKNEDEYFEFENQVIKYVENKTRYVKVFDTDTNEEKVFKEVSEFANKIGVTNARIISAISGKCLMMKRYKVEYGTTTVKELISC